MRLMSKPKMAKFVNFVSDCQLLTKKACNLDYAQKFSPHYEQMTTLIRQLLNFRFRISNKLAAFRRFLCWLLIYLHL